MTEILTTKDKTREEKIAIAKRVKAELEEHVPEMAELRDRLVSMGMMADNFSSVVRVITPNIDYNVSRDDPDHFERRFRRPLIITEEIHNAVQDRKAREAGASGHVRDARGSHRRR